jgi:serine/threonine protein kinase
LLDVLIQDEKRLCFSIRAALTHLHENGVIHRGIKPGNVLMFSAGDPKSFIPKLLDFEFSIFAEDFPLELPLVTANWEAPEIVERNPSRLHMRLSDAYSFWAINLLHCELG